MYDEYFDEKNHEEIYQNLNDKPFIKEILVDFIETFNKQDTEDEWFNKIKDICDKYNYASNMKDYKENSDIYNGHIGDVCMFIRNIITTKNESPNLYEILKILELNTIEKRINQFITYQKELEK